MTAGQPGQTQSRSLQMVPVEIWATHPRFSYPTDNCCRSGTKSSRGLHALSCGKRSGHSRADQGSLHQNREAPRPFRIARLLLWSPRPELNWRPTHYECVALPLSYSGICLRARRVARRLVDSKSARRARTRRGVEAHAPTPRRLAGKSLRSIRRPRPPWSRGLAPAQASGPGSEQPCRAPS